MVAVVQLAERADFPVRQARQDLCIGNWRCALAAVAGKARDVTNAHWVPSVAPNAKPADHAGRRPESRGSVAECVKPISPSIPTKPRNTECAPNTKWLP